MKKLIFLIAVQTLFKQGFAQVQDTIHITIDSSDFAIPYTEKRDAVQMKPETLDDVVWMINSLNATITTYQALVLQYSIQDSIQEHQESLLQQVINTQNQQLKDKQETIVAFDGLLETSTSTVNLMLQQQKSSRKSAAFKVVAGVAGGLLVGFGVGVLCGF